MHFMMSEYCTLEKKAHSTGNLTLVLKSKIWKKSANFDRDKQLLGNTITLCRIFRNVTSNSIKTWYHCNCNCSHPRSKKRFRKNSKEIHNFSPRLNYDRSKKYDGFKQRSNCPTVRLSVFWQRLGTPFRLRHFLVSYFYR